MNFVLCSLFYSVSAKVSFAKNKVLSVCRPIIPKGLLLWRKQGSYVDWSICNCYT
jgi:hypothetical protein